ncbi:hypothetical protein D3C78_1286750 [compost metagenome]
MFGLQFMVIHAVDNRRVKIVTTGMGKQDFFSACRKVCFSVFTVTVYAGAVENHIHAQFTPRQRFNTLIMQHANGIVANE